MQRWLMYGVLMGAALGISGCSSGNFLVYKNSKHFYVTSTGPELRRILCDTGDMEKIARDSRLSAPLQKDLKDGICTSNKVKERLLATLEGMTKEQRTALKTAFRQNGYDINVVANC